MKKLWARISMELEVTEEEYERLKKLATEEETGNTDDIELDSLGLYGEDLKRRFIKDGQLSDDSYISDAGSGF